MSITSWISAKVFGELILDLGSVQTSAASDKWRLSLSLRRRTDRPILAFDWKEGNETKWMSIDADPATLEKLEEMIHSAREQVNAMHRA
jgi:hypothetical protein